VVNDPPAVPHRIESDHEHDRRMTCGLGCLCSALAARRNHGGAAANHLCHQSRQPIDLIVAPSVVDHNALALDKSGFV
jgi:hypothetical protein